MEYLLVFPWNEYLSDQRQFEGSLLANCYLGHPQIQETGLEESACSLSNGSWTLIKWPRRVELGPPTQFGRLFGDKDISCSRHLPEPFMMNGTAQKGSWPWLGSCRNVICHSKQPTIPDALRGKKQQHTRSIIWPLLCQQHVKVSRVILEHYVVAMTTFPFPALGRASALFSAASPRFPFCNVVPLF